MNNRNDENAPAQSKQPESKTGGTQSGKPGVRRKRAGFATMSNLMNKLVVNIGLDQRLKEHALMNLWPTIAGDKFATNSRCLFIDNERKLVVSVRDASVGQELSLMRRDLMRKIEAAASGLGVKIDNIRFDMKNFYQKAEEQHVTSYENALLKPSPEDLQSVILSPEEIQQIDAMRTKPEDPSSIKGYGLSSKLKLSDRIATIFEHELRLKKWRIDNGYPLCGECREPEPLLHGAESLCAHCFYKAISPRSI